MSTRTVVSTRKGLARVLSTRTVILAKFTLCIVGCSLLFSLVLGFQDHRGDGIRKGESKEHAASSYTLSSTVAPTPDALVRHGALKCIQDVASRLAHDEAEFSYLLDVDLWSCCVSCSKTLSSLETSFAPRGVVSLHDYGNAEYEKGRSDLGKDLCDKATDRFMSASIRLAAGCFGEWCKSLQDSLSSGWFQAQLCKGVFGLQPRLTTFAKPTSPSSKIKSW